MKKILVATDFSEASFNAFLFAVALARDTGASVHLYHAYESTQPIPESFLVFNSPDLWIPIKEKMEDMIKKASVSEQVAVTINGDHGIAADLIVKEASLVKADLIVCGLKHPAFDLRSIFGSIATAVSHKTTVPLLVVPHKAIYQPVKHIALACDTDRDTSPDTVTLLRELADRFASSLSVVLVGTDMVTAKYDLLFQPLPFLDVLKSCGARIELAEGENISSSLLKFADREKIDLLTVVSHKHSLFDRLIVQSVTRQLLFHTHIPLLILPQIRTSDDDLQKLKELEQDTFYREFQ